MAISGKVAGTCPFGTCPSGTCPFGTVPLVGNAANGRGGRLDCAEGLASWAPPSCNRIDNGFDMNVRYFFAVGAACLLWAASAGAVTVTRADGLPLDPAGEPMTVSGHLAMSKLTLSTNCEVTLTGTIKPNADVRITAVKFAGNGRCNLIKPLVSDTAPWTGEALSPTQLQIDNMGAHVPLFGDCGPSKIVPVWSNASSSLTIEHGTLAPDCSLAGRVVISPALHVE